MDYNKGLNLVLKQLYESSFSQFVVNFALIYINVLRSEASKIGKCVLDILYIKSIVFHKHKGSVTSMMVN